MDFKLSICTKAGATHGDGKEDDDGVLWRGRGGRRHVKYPLSSIAPAVAQLRSAWHDLI